MLEFMSPQDITHVHTHARRARCTKINPAPHHMACDVSQGNEIDTGPDRDSEVTGRSV